MMLPGIALLALLAAAPHHVAVAATVAPSRARYVLQREPHVRGLALPSHEAAGWRQRARLLPTGATELTIVSTPTALSIGRDPSDRPPEGQRLLDRAGAVAPEVRLLAQELAAGARDPWEISERVVTWVSLNVRHDADPRDEETAAAALGRRRASCVGRSRLAADLLVASGIPARTIHGALATEGGAGLTLHRFLETWIDGTGWVPSDPGESIHAVDARHIFIATDSERYDPESQRGLTLKAAEPLRRPLAGEAVEATLRPLVVAPRPRPPPDRGRVESSR